MRTLNKSLVTFLLAAVLAVPVIISSGCAARVETGRVYDPYYSDYHAWNGAEVTYYNQWETQTHRTHEDFSKRNSDEQKEYWNWRHEQADKH